MFDTVWITLFVTIMDKQFCIILFVQRWSVSLVYGVANIKKSIHFITSEITNISENFYICNICCMTFNANSYNERIVQSIMIKRTLYIKKKNQNLTLKIEIDNLN